MWTQRTIACVGRFRIVAIAFRLLPHSPPTEVGATEVTCP